MTDGSVCGKKWKLFQTKLNPYPFPLDSENAQQQHGEPLLDLEQSDESRAP